MLSFISMSESKPAVVWQFLCIHASRTLSVQMIEFEQTPWLSLKLRSGDCLLFGVIYNSRSLSESHNSALNTGHSLTMCIGVFSLRCGRRLTFLV